MDLQMAQKCFYRDKSFDWICKQKSHTIFLIWAILMFLSHMKSGDQRRNQRRNWKMAQLISIFVMCNFEVSKGAVFFQLKVTLRNSLSRESIKIVCFEASLQRRNFLKLIEQEFSIFKMGSDFAQKSSFEMCDFFQQSFNEISSGKITGQKIPMLYLWE